jgi:hypothetical protein
MNFQGTPIEMTKMTNIWLKQIIRNKSREQRQYFPNKSIDGQDILFQVDKGKGGEVFLQLRKKREGKKQYKSYFTRLYKEGDIDYIEKVFLQDAFFDYGDYKLKNKKGWDFK